jgi:hypothetical protein
LRGGRSPAFPKPTTGLLFLNIDVETNGVIRQLKFTKTDIQFQVSFHVSMALILDETRL